MSIVFSKCRFSERLGFQRIPLWLDGFFSVSSEFLPAASVSPEEDSSSCLDACPVVTGQPNTWWTV